MRDPLDRFRPREAQFGNKREMFSYDMTYLEQVALFAASVITHAARIVTERQAKKAA